VWPKSREYRKKKEKWLASAILSINVRKGKSANYRHHQPDHWIKDQPPLG
jgi:hypothetical protein